MRYIIRFMVVKVDDGITKKAKQEVLFEETVILMTKSWQLMHHINRSSTKLELDEKAGEKSVPCSTSNLLNSRN